jgi:hypothetical protein
MSAYKLQTPGNYPKESIQQGPKSLRWQPQTSNDPLSNSHKTGFYGVSPEC